MKAWWLVLLVAVLAAFVLGRSDYDISFLVYVSVSLVCIETFIRAPPKVKPPTSFVRTGTKSEFIFEGTPNTKVESVEWLNVIIRKKWKVFGPYINKVTKAAIQRCLDNTRPPSVKAIVCSDFTIGDIAPELVSFVGHDTENPEDVVVDIKLKYISDLHITLVAKAGIVSVPVQTKALEVEGTLRVYMELIGESPFLNQLQMAFLEKPRIVVDISILQETGSGIGIPGLQSYLSNLVTNGLDTVMVLPHKYVLPWACAIPKRPVTVRVKVVEAAELEAKDIAVYGESTSDPYCIVRHGRTEFRTTTIYDSLNPVWNRSFELTVPDMNTGTLQFFLFDEDPVTDDELGDCTIDLSRLELGVNEFWEPLRNTSTGRLHLCVTIQEQGANASVFLEPGTLEVLLHDAANLRPPSMLDTLATKVHLQVGGSELQSETVKGDHPVWNSLFTFQIGDRNTDELLLRVVEMRVLFKPNERPLGRSLISLSGLVPGDTKDLWLSLDNNQNGRLHLELTFHPLETPTETTPEADTTIANSDKKTN